LTQPLSRFCLVFFKVLHPPLRRPCFLPPNHFYLSSYHLTLFHFTIMQQVYLSTLIIFPVLLRCIAVLRPQMRPILTDRVVSSVTLLVCLWVCYTSEPCKNGCTDRAAVWVEDLGGPREPCIRWGSRSHHGKGQIFGGEWASHCKV